MNFFRLLPVMLSMFLLGAHFFRSGNYVLVSACAAIIPMLLLRRSWIARFTQIVLLAGGLEWGRTLLGLVRIRQSSGMPWIRLAIILGIVALMTICSALVFRSKHLRDRYRL